MLLACANVPAAARPKSKTAASVIKTKRRRLTDAISKFPILVVFWFKTLTIPLSHHSYNGAAHCQSSSGFRAYTTELWDKLGSGRGPVPLAPTDVTASNY